MFPGMRREIGRLIAGSPTTGHVLYLDESERGAHHGVGGVMVAATEAGLVEAAWNRHKQELGLDSSDELKFTMPEKHPSRERLEHAGRTHADRLPDTLRLLCKLPITLVACVHVGNEQTPARAHYLDCFRWCVANYASHLLRRSGRGGIGGPHQVIIDRPSAPSMERLTNCPQRVDWHRGDESVHYVYEQLRLGNATSDVFAGMDPDASHRANLLPELGASCSSTSALLQIADHVVGAAFQFADGHLESRDQAWRDENFALLARCFIRGGGQLGMGLIGASTELSDSLGDAVRRHLPPVATPNDAGRSGRAGCCGSNSIRVDRRRVESATRSPLPTGISPP